MKQNDILKHIDVASSSLTKEIFSHIAQSKLERTRRAAKILINLLLEKAYPNSIHPPSLADLELEKFIEEINDWFLMNPQKSDIFLPFKFRFLCWLFELPFNRMWKMIKNNSCDDNSFGSALILSSAFLYLSEC